MCTRPCRTASRSPRSCKDLAASGASSDSPLLAGRSEIRNDVLRRHHRRPRSVRWLQRRRPARRPRARSRPTCSPAATTSIVPVGRKAEGYFRFRGYHLGQAVHRLLRPADLRRRQAIGEHVVDLFTSRRGRLGRARLHPLHLGRHAGSRAASARAAAARRRSPVATAGPAAPTAPAATTSSSPTRRRSSTRCCRATSRPASTPRCSTPRRPSTPSASGR